MLMFSSFGENRAVTESSNFTTGEKYRTAEKITLYVSLTKCPSPFYLYAFNYWGTNILMMVQVISNCSDCRLLQ